jgi:acyl-CoA thioesterase II
VLERERSQIPAEFVAIPAQLLALEETGNDLFRNCFSDINPLNHLFGGQVLSQALMAASATVYDRAVHSLHGYFLRAGRADCVVDFTVERVRDGGSFSVRNVVARQNGTAIFQLTASFKVSGESGYRHSPVMPDGIPPPEALPTLFEAANMLGERLPALQAAFLRRMSFIDVRFIEPLAILAEDAYLRRGFWLRMPGAAPIVESASHSGLLAFASDLWLANTILVQHPQKFAGPDLFVTSLDHAMWFGAPVRIDEWVFYDAQSPFAIDERGLATGMFFDRFGRHVASVAQEALARCRNRLNR